MTDAGVEGVARELDAGLERGPRLGDVGDAQRDDELCGAVKVWPMFVGSIR